MRFRLLLCCLLLVSACAREDGSRAVDQLRTDLAGKNVVMILLDAAAYAHFGFAGYPRDTTPRIDALAEEGIVFRNGYSPAASTGHTVYSMLTSSYPFLAEREGLKGVVAEAFRVEEDTPLMADLLAPRFPRRLGITGNNWFGPEFGFDRGFTHFHETYDAAAVPDSTLRRAGRTLDLFRRDLAEWEDGEPVFAYLHFLEPHTPYTPPEEFARKFDPEAKDRVAVGGRDLLQYRTDPPPPQEQEWIKALYDGNLAYVDHVVGQVFDSLREAGRWEDTVVLVIADHGEGFWQHGVWGHGRHTYDEFVRIPFVLRIPGRPDLAGTTVEDPVSLVDLLPTWLDASGLPIPEGRVGQSLLPLILGQRDDFKRRGIHLRNTHSDVPEFALRIDRWKWIYKMKEGRYECYDLAADPLERRDLVAAGAVPEAIANEYEKIALWIATGTERVQPVEEMDPRTREQLRAIGYF